MTLSDAQQRAQSELQSGESLYWTGTADPRRAALTAFPAGLFGIPFAGFALFWITSAYHATSAMSTSSSNSFTRGFAIFPLFGLPFLLIGLGVILTPLWVYLKGLSTVYAVTSQRVMIITGGSSRSVKSCTPADIVSVDHRERPDGSGDVLIRTTAQTRTNNSVSQVTLGLFGVSNVKEVARQVMNLHTQQRPAA
jgi:PH (Pleckstrin Homology) domain-containing protein